MKYYHYLSESKVDMLFPQVPRAMREKISAEVGFNLGLVSGKVGSEAALLDDVVARLKVVEQYLVKRNVLGSVNAPREWFVGEMAASTVGLWSGGGAVFFMGTTGAVTVALGGSMRNMIGGKHVTAAGPPFSYLAPLLDGLEALVKNETATRKSVSLPTLPGSEVVTPFGDPRTWEELVQLIVDKARVPTERIHFVARLLAKGKAGKQRVILGTPLYVAAGSPGGAV